MSIQRLIVPVDWKAASDDGESGTLEGYLSTFGNTDLQGDVIERGAFAKTVNRVNKDGIPLLADHNASVRDVLGTIVQASEDSHGLKIKARFASDPDSQAVRQKLLDGHLKAMSIGYEPKEWGIREEADGQRVRVLKEVKLWEGSVVVFPANPEALVGAVKSAVRSTLDTIVAGAVANGGDEQDIKAAVAGWAASLPGEAKKAIGPHSTGTSTSSWDADAAVKRLPDDAGAATLRREFAWVDPDGDAATKAAYKFPHHEVSSDGTVGAANVSGCQTGIAVLNGSMGGADIPAADRQGVYDHLAKHLRDAGVEPPELRAADQDALESGKAGDGTREDRVKRLMHGAENILSGHDPDAVADPVAYAGMEARLGLLGQWVVNRSRQAELADELDHLRGRS